MTEPIAAYEVDSVTEAGTIATLAERATKVDVHVLDVHATDGRTVLEQHIYGRGAEGELERVDTIDVDATRREATGRGPDRLAGLIHVHSPATLSDYAARHIDGARSTLWGDVPNAKVTVVLNDHTADGQQGWADHRVALQLETSPELAAWLKHDDQAIGQETFGDFLEERLLDIIDPDGSTMLEVARTFSATVGATFRRAVNGHDGTTSLTWQEDVDAKAGKSGQLEVPREFTIGVPPYVGCAAVKIRGLFRYRVADGQLRLGYRLLNLDDVRRQAVAEVLTEVGNRLDLVAFEGVAPQARR